MDCRYGISLSVSFSSFSYPRLQGYRGNVFAKDMCALVVPSKRMWVEDLPVFAQDRMGERSTFHGQSSKGKQLQSRKPILRKFKISRLYSDLICNGEWRWVSNKSCNSRMRVSERASSRTQMSIGDANCVCHILDVFASVTLCDFTIDLDQ